MSRIGGDAEGEQTPKKPASLAKRLLILAVVMSAYVYLRLSTSRLVFPGVVIALSIAEVVLLIKAFRESRRLEALSELAYFLVLFSFLFGILRHYLDGQYAVLYITILYRPYYTLYRNQRLALGLGALILAVTVPIMLGIVTDPDLLGLLTALYGLLVAGLWLFCSKLGAWVLRSAG